MANKICGDCLEPYDGGMRQIFCPKCKIKRQKEASARIQARRVKARFEPKPCVICGTSFKPVSSKMKLCGSIECKKAQEKIKKRDRKAPIPGSDDFKIMFEPEEDIKSFTYTKMLNECRKKVRIILVANKDSTSSSLVAHKTNMMVNAIIKKMDKNSDEYKLIILEREYIREIDKERLRRNIKLVLKVNSAEGEFTLEETGSVLGISRERVRQILYNATNMLKSPNTSRAMMPYLYDSLESDSMYSGEKL